MMHVVILGCGQLARLLAESGEQLNLDFTFVAIEDESVDCVKHLGPIVHWRKGISAEALLQATGMPDVVTVERESIDTKLLYELSLLCQVSPSPEIVATCQHRLKEKMGLSKLDIPMTPWFPVSDNKSLYEAVKMCGYPLIIKAFENGYDGKNQWHINNSEELEELVKEVDPKDWIIEPKINFITEASLIGVRSLDGEIRFYPVTENHHESGILKRSIAPLENIADSEVKKIQKSLKKLMESWQYVGVMTMELFLTKDGFMVNELAPRVHNSGHWTKNSDVTCQFENHLRAILGKPLGETNSPYYNGMINLLGKGTKLPKIDLPDGEIYLYGKLPRAGRKLGHINMFDSDRTNLIRRMSNAEEILSLSNNGAR
ncbi:MAG: 5-(carboxyamino)imidazole ribonucleotide synthase [Kangiellaceae bacterium]|nr:5-(carboxyamino)imidazole ribonucleotide synthase [Kangiellaceae bacterium]MCW8997462.1 5-(carboxyamino)imidazole ribonucleotide synthase [Kangiellaceae bacterium]MCW9016512.1 5-(carboxyamino)imidazole ribonucleotide synthase [Kangiellaceae bacterium]